MTTPLKNRNGGLELAKLLGRHLWKPLLHEVATGSLDEGVDALSYLAHARNHGFQFQLGSVVDINREGKPSPSASCAMKRRAAGG